MVLICDEITQEISSEILAISEELNQKGFNTQSQGRVIEVPYLKKLEPRVAHSTYIALSLHLES